MLLSKKEISPVYGPWSAGQDCSLGRRSSVSGRRCSLSLPRPTQLCSGPEPITDSVTIYCWFQTASDKPVYTFRSRKKLAKNLPYICGTNGGHPDIYCETMHQLINMRNQMYTLHLQALVYAMVFIINVTDQWHTDQWHTDQWHTDQWHTDQWHTDQWHTATSGTLPPVAHCHQWHTATSGTLPPVAHCHQWHTATSGTLPPVAHCHQWHTDQWHTATN